jgi:hypothetical protein
MSGTNLHRVRASPAFSLEGQEWDGKGELQLPTGLFVLESRGSAMHVGQCEVEQLIRKAVALTGRIG